MAAGLNATLTRQVVDEVCGAAAQALNVAFTDVLEAQAFLDVQDDAILAGLGYAPDEIATLRSALGDLAALRAVYVGDAEVTPARDFREFANRIWGTGGALPGH